MVLQVTQQVGKRVQSADTRAKNLEEQREKRVAKSIISLGILIKYPCEGSGFFVLQPSLPFRTSPQGWQASQFIPSPGSQPQSWWWS